MRYLIIEYYSGFGANCMVLYHEEPHKAGPQPDSTRFLVRVRFGLGIGGRTRFGCLTERPGKLPKRRSGARPSG